MKAYVVLVLMLVMAVSAVADAHATDSKTQPKDQPNYHPKVTTEKVDGKNLEIVEFQCRLAK